MATRTRRLVPALGLALAVTIPTAVAVAAPAERITEHSVHIGCDLLHAEGADAYFSASAGGTGSGGSLQLWLAPDDIIVDPPSVISGASDLLIGEGDTTLTGTLQLLADEVSGEPVGSATLEAILSPAGPAETIERSVGDSNHKARETETIQPLSVSGTLTVSLLGEPEIVLALDGCDGMVSDLIRFANAPSSMVSWGEALKLECLWVTDDLWVRLQAENSSDLEFGDIGIFSPSLGGFTNISDVVAFSRTAFEASFELASTGAGITATGGTATASAVLDPQERVTYVVQEEGSRLKVVIQPFAVSGMLSIALDDGSEFVLAVDNHACWQAADGSSRVMQSSSQGGNQQVATNDAPKDAKPMRAGGVASAHTGGTVLEGEAVTDCLFDGFSHLNLGHSVWYTFVGTGAEISLDTDGSNFDTVLAVYAADERGGLTEVACGDDVQLEPFGFSRQARVTMQTEPSVLYYVQAGGFVDQSGHLQLRLD